jgi:hypothetical protein
MIRTMVPKQTCCLNSGDVAMARAPIPHGPLQLHVGSAADGVLGA